MSLTPSMDVLAFYSFSAVDDVDGLVECVQGVCATHALCGTVLVASEGVNGTVAGGRPGLDALLALFTERGFDPIQVRWSTARSAPFARMKVRRKSEIVTLGVEVDPRQQVGEYVEPEAWNALLASGVICIDVRNDYEVAVGSFKGAVDPKTSSFREFPQFVEAFEGLADKPPVAMFCTGGIRCEKASSYLLQAGFDSVYHLKGGILGYLERVGENESLWEGQCFVFDERVSVGHGLVQGDLTVCHGCRHPLTSADRAHPDFTPDVQCPHCAPTLDDDARARRIERARQQQLARERGTTHVRRGSE